MADGRDGVGAHGWQPVGLLLQRIAGELSELGRAHLRLEAVVSDRINRYGPQLDRREVRDLQGLDAVAQTLDDLARLAGWLGTHADPSWRCDARTAVGALKLEELAERLRLGKVARPDNDAIVEMFDDVDDPLARGKASPRPFVLRAERRPCSVRGRLETRDGVVDCTIINASSGGYGFLLDPVFRVRTAEPVTVTTQEAGTQACIVRWCAHPRYGAEFVHKPISRRYLDWFASLPNEQA